MKRGWPPGAGARRRGARRELELNVIPLVRVGVGASYRHTSDIDLPGTPEDAMRGSTPASASRWRFLDRRTLAFSGAGSPTEDPALVLKVGHF